jgi:puromycin-sensitive aminopeptidase
VVPRRYEITLEPDLEQAVFSGSETITVEVTEPTTEVVLNARELQISEAVLRSGDRVLTGKVTYEEAEQRARIALEEGADPGEWRLELKFTGVLNDQLAGFYKSTFVDVDGVTQAIATTQFEATDARRAFPCWDEPDLKAVFAITLVVPDHLSAVSNSAEVERSPTGEGQVKIRFADTIVMSTYLVAFVVGPFEATEPVVVDGVPIRIIAPRGKLHLARYALDCAGFCLHYFREYYGIPYPGDKVDHVAIPDFAFGAMENLGCITYRETALLVDPETASQSELVRVLDVIGHELAHMWFGDLVTMRWWDGIWLNEAFASFMEYKSTDAMHPEWKRWLGFGAVERPWAYGVDALQSTRPVEFEVKSPEEANEMFDALTYGKGSSVLRMMEQYIGEEAFRQGVGDYLRRHSYGNTVTSDLWAGLNRASGEPVGEIMDTWIRQPGFPQLDVERIEGGIRLRQRRFLSIPDETDPAHWQIPVKIRSGVGEPAVTSFLLQEPEATLALADPDRVVANAGGHGFYRVRYDPGLFRSLVAGLPALEDLERFILVDDTWAFVESGQLSVVDFLSLAAAYREETEQAVWQAVLGGVGAVSHHLIDDPHRDLFSKWVADLVGPGFHRLGWEAAPGETDLTRRLRGQLILAMGRLAQDPEVIGRARQTSALPRLEGLDPEVARAALFVSASHAGADEHGAYLAKYQASKLPQEQDRLLVALALFDHPQTVVENVRASLDGRIRSQDGARVIGATYANRRHGHLAWKEVRQRWDQFTRLPTVTQRRMIEGLPALSRPEVAAEVEAFLAETPLPHATKSVDQNLERLRVNVLLRQREAEAVGRFLEAAAGG